MIFLVRHGQSEGNVDGNVYKTKRDIDIELTSLGVEQIKSAAALISKFLREHYPGHYSNKVIYHSGLVRTKHSAQLLQKRIGDFEIREEILFHEQLYGEANGYYLPDFIEAFPKEKEMYNLMGHMYYTPPRGESLMDVYGRAGIALLKYNYFRDNGVTVIVGHNEMNSMMHGHLTQTTPIPNSWNNGEVRVYINGEVTKL